MGANDKGSTALLLIFCSLDVLRRVGGPFGVVAASVSCILLIVGIVWVIIWAQASDDLNSNNSSSAAERRHTPSESVYSFWVNALVVFLILSVLVTPTTYYVRRSMVSNKPPPVVEAVPVPTDAAKFPLIPLQQMIPLSVSV